MEFAAPHRQHGNWQLNAAASWTAASKTAAWYNHPSRQKFSKTWQLQPVHQRNGIVTELGTKDVVFYLEAVEGAVVFDQEVLALADREEVAVLTQQIGYVNSLHCSTNCKSIKSRVLLTSTWINHYPNPRRRAAPWAIQSYHTLPTVPIKVIIQLINNILTTKS